MDRRHYHKVCRPDEPLLDLEEPMDSIYIVLTGQIQVDELNLSFKKD